ncbi:hypothetical protein [Pseudanabaena sp. 'Roaring Creek']|nr:hypothetical protein [Pseudanabaena sp. 'Roaring Creek']
MVWDNCGLDELGAIAEVILSVRARYAQDINTDGDEDYTDLKQS